MTSIPRRHQPTSTAELRTQDKRARAMRMASWVVPVALLVYAICRWLDGRNGSHGPGVWWSVGHVAFLMTWLAFAVLAVLMAVQLSVTYAAYWAIAGACLIGIAAFAWVTVTDLFPDVAELPDPLRALGPLLFLIGFCVLLGATARRDEHRRWVLYPVLTVAAVVAVAVNLSLLLVTAALFVPALAPCRRSLPSRPVT